MAKGRQDFRCVYRVCLVCETVLTLHNTRDIIRKQFCSHSCQYKWFHKNGKTPASPRPTQETYAKIGAKAKEQMQLGLRAKPPRKQSTGNKKQYFCIDCGKVIDRKAKRCMRCYRSHTSVRFDCDYCGKTYMEPRNRYNQKKHHFCNKDCWRNWRRSKFSAAKKKLICPVCEAHFVRYRSLIPDDNVACCSVHCAGILRSLAQSGKKASCYIDGRTPLIKLIKGSSQYDSWRKRVFIRDSFKCVRCGHGGFLHVHHKNSFAGMMRDFMGTNYHLDVEDNMVLLRNFALSYAPFWDISNGETLCVNCHRIEHPNVNLMAERKIACR